jgi:putative sterol carrier protein
MDDNLPISEQYRVIAKKWVDADSAANLLEETKSAFLSQKMVALGDMPVSRAELTVKASEEWTDFVTKMVRAREQANLLKVQLEYIRMKSMENQSYEATRRAEMKL